MARTPSGKCIGVAARIERIDWLEAVRQAHNAKQQEFILDFGDALNRLKEIDPEWEAWYDGRPEQSLTLLLPLIENRVANIEIAKFGAELREQQEAEWEWAEMCDEDEERARDHRAEQDYAHTCGYHI